MILNLLRPLVDLEEWVLEALHSAGLGWGLAIVALTLLVRAAIVPITVRQLHAQRRLAEHAPELKRLRERHADDPAKLRDATLAYYREHGINPLGALLPLLLQIPVFLSLYALMRQDVGSGLFGHAGFLFIPDITARPHGAVLVALVATYATSQLASTLIATRAMQGGQRGLAVALPLLFIGVAARFPAGLLIYWITSSLWSFGQQLVLWRARRGLPVPAMAGAPPPPDSSQAPPRSGRAQPRKKRKHGRKRR